MTTDLHREYYGKFKAFGRTDPDEVFAKKQELIRPWAAQMKLGRTLMILGLPALLVGVGILVIVYGFILRTKSSPHVVAIESAYKQYCNDVGIASAG